MATIIEEKRVLHLSQVHFGLKGISWSALSEKFWFSVSLALFMVLGPFAAPIALFTLFNLDAAERGVAEPEALEDMA
jgi:hypothetical protein